MSRSFNGTNQSMLTSSNITPLGVKLAFSAWVKWTAGNAGFLAEFSPDEGATTWGWYFRPGGGPGGTLEVMIAGNVGRNRCYSQAALPTGRWVHLVVQIDKGLSGNETDSIYFDGVAQGIDPDASFQNNNTNGFAGDVLYFMSRGNNQLWAAGLMADVAIWSTLLTVAEVANLVRGLSPLMVNSANLQWYWPVLGKKSPETECVAAKTLTLAGSPPESAIHPRAFSFRAPRVGARGALRGMA